MAAAIPIPAQRAPAPNINVSAQDLPYWMPINVTLTANQSGATGRVAVENDAEFEWRSIMASSTGAFSVQLFNNYIKRPYMASAINGENFAGTSQNPALLPIPYRLARTSIIEGIFNDRSGAGNVVQLTLWGYKKYSNTPSGILLPSVLPYRKAISHVYMPKDEDLVQLQNKIPYWWPILDATVGSQQAQRSKVTMPSGSYATHLIGSSSLAAGFVLQIFDTERGQIFEDAPITQFANHAGSAQRPFWFKKVYALPSDGQIQVRVINLGKASNAIQVVLCGLRD